MNNSNPFSTKDVLLEEDIDPETNLLNDTKFQKLNSPHHTPATLINYFIKSSKDCFSIFHLNVRSINKNFKQVKDLMLSQMIL